MRNFLTAVCLLVSCAAFSQATFPAIGQGSKLQYLVSTSNGSNKITVILDSVSSQYMKWGWKLDDGTQGSWIMKKFIGKCKPGMVERA